MRCSLRLRNPRKGDLVAFGSSNMRNDDIAMVVDVVAGAHEEGERIRIIWLYAATLSNAMAADDCSGPELDEHLYTIKRFVLLQRASQ